MSDVDKFMSTIPGGFTKKDFLEVAALMIDQAIATKGFSEDGNKLEKIYDSIEGVRQSKDICPNSFKEDSSHRWRLPEWHNYGAGWAKRHTCTECGFERHTDHQKENPLEVGS